RIGAIDRPLPSAGSRWSSRSIMLICASPESTS
ncbi:MAG: hypothetical protein ACI9CV_002217, partial [Ilumatobacter sp.]